MAQKIAASAPFQYSTIPPSHSFIYINTYYSYCFHYFVYQYKLEHHCNWHSYMLASSTYISDKIIVMVDYENQPASKLAD